MTPWYVPWLHTSQYACTFRLNWLCCQSFLIYMWDQAVFATCWPETPCWALCSSHVQLLITPSLISNTISHRFLLPLYNLHESLTQFLSLKTASYKPHASAGRRKDSWLPPIHYVKVMFLLQLCMPIMELIPQPFLAWWLYQWLAKRVWNTVCLKAAASPDLVWTVKAQMRPYRGPFLFEGIARKYMVFMSY